MITQGGLDGGLDIPHGDKRFVGYDTEAKKLDTEQLKKYILGGHVSPCVTHLCAPCMQCWIEPLLVAAHSTCKLLVMLISTLPMHKHKEPRLMASM